MLSVNSVVQRNRSCFHSVLPKTQVFLCVLCGSVVKKVALVFIVLPQSLALLRVLRASVVKKHVGHWTRSIILDFFFPQYLQQHLLCPEDAYLNEIKAQSKDVSYFLVCQFLEIAQYYGRPVLLRQQGYGFF